MFSIGRFGRLFHHSLDGKSYKAYIGVMPSNNLKKIGSVIKNLRETKGISQELLAKSLDLPRPSVSQIENGDRDVSFAEINRILEVFQISYDEFTNLIRPKIKNSQTKNKQKNKGIKFDSEKFKQLFLYILQKCGSKPNVGETVIYKLLYFCDFDYFELYEKSISGMRYKKLQYGPVPDQALFYPEVQKMISLGQIQRVVHLYAENILQTRYMSFVEPETTVFNPQEIELINKVINRLSDMNARQIEAHVHKDYPWAATAEEGEEIDYNSVFSRTGEFAQRDYDAEILAASAEDSFGGLDPISEEDYNYYVSLPEKNA